MITAWKLFLFSVLALSSSNLLAAENIFRTSTLGDKGTYYIVEQSRKGNVVRALTKRIGVSAVDYSLVEVNCSTMLMRGLGESESVPPTEGKPTKWFALIPNSSKSDLARYVCAPVGNKKK